MNSVYVRVVSISRKYPITRGIAAYAVIWPTSSLAQQVITGHELDYPRVMRFAVFGACFVAPTLHMWLKVANAMWPTMSIKSAISKVRSTRLWPILAAKYVKDEIILFILVNTLPSSLDIVANVPYFTPFLPLSRVTYYFCQFFQTLTRNYGLAVRNAKQQSSIRQIN